MSDPGYEIRTRPCGGYLLIEPHGRYSAELLDELQRYHFSEPAQLAIDLNGLHGIALPLVRALQNYARENGRLLLVRPPEKVRSLLKLLGDDLPFVASEQDLEGDPEERRREFFHTVDRARHEIQTHPLWNMTDLDGRWLCPYCAHVIQNIRLVSKQNVSQVTLEKVAFHLLTACKGRDENLEPWTEEVLRRVLDHQNGELESERKSSDTVRRLRDRAERAGKLEEEMKGAAERQQRLLPATPALPGFQLAVYSRPLDDLGGDWYDFVPLSGGRLALVIGDVSGHGIQAAVITGMAKKVLRIRLRESADLPAALARANEDLREELAQDSFVTAVVAVVDPEKRAVTYARAGHPPGLLLVPGPDVIPLEAPGPVLGMLPTPAFSRILRAETRELPDDSVLLLYSDGLEDARGPEGDEFGADRVAVTLASIAEEETAILLASLALTVDEHTEGRGPDDDVTAIALRAEARG